MDLREVSDRLEINEILARYCHALDMQNWPAFRALFTGDAQLDFAAFGGPVGNLAEIEAHLRPALESLKSSLHVSTTVMIDLDGDTARARSAAIVPLTRPGAQDNDDTLFNGLFYEDVLTRTADGWRISARKQVRSFVYDPAA